MSSSQGPSLSDPKRYIRGNRMSFSGIPDEQERADLMDYLATVLQKP